jgi:hypothetical protein
MRLVLARMKSQAEFPPDLLCCAPAREFYIRQFGKTVVVVDLDEVVHTNSRCKSCHTPFEHTPCILVRAPKEAHGYGYVKLLDFDEGHVFPSLDLAEAALLSLQTEGQGVICQS